MSISVRVQLRPEIKNKLEEIAKEFNCLYDNKPSLSLLLSNIARGQIKLDHSVSIKKIDGIVIGLRIIVPFYFYGIVNLITGCISQNGGNILTINTMYFDDCHNPPFEGTVKGLLDIKLTLSNNGKIHKLLNKINDVKLESLHKFKNNKKKDIEELQFAFAYKFSTYLKNQTTSYDDNEDVLNEIEKFTKNPKSARLAIETICTIGIRIKIINLPGLASEITEIIAIEGIMITYMEQTLDTDDDNIAYISIHLMFRSINQNEDEKSINKIDKIKKDISKISSVVMVEMLNLV